MATPAPPTDSVPSVGSKVTLIGLVGRAELNGAIGTVVVAFDPARGRVGVKVKGEAKPLALRPANLAPIPRSAAATGGAAVKPPEKVKIPPVGRQKFVYDGQTVYEWEQTLDDVKIYIAPPPGLAAADMEITIAERELKVGLRGADRPFLHERFPSVVKVVDSWWMLDDGEIEIQLTKMRKAEMWPCALAGHGEVRACSRHANSLLLALRRPPACNHAHNLALRSALRSPPHLAPHTHSTQMDVFTREQVQKSMMLERFGEENPGFDFSGAEFSGSCPDPRNFMGGVKHQR